MQHKFFVTGGLGYIGSAFAKEALKKGFDVVLYDSLLYEQDHRRIMKEILSTHIENATAKLIIGDTRNIELLEKSIKESGATFILHLAELSSVYSCNHNPPYTADNNYNASKRVIDLCEKLKLPVIYNSSSSLYGNQPKMKLMTEKDPLPAPTDNYCKYKIMMEDHIKKIVKKNPDFKIIVFRPATVCGPAPRMRLELLPNHFTYLAIAKGVLRISELNACRAAIDINDLVDGYFAVIEKGYWKKLIYNIGHHNMSKKDFATGIQSVIKCELGKMTDLGDLRNLQTDNSLFNKEFDFKPKIAYVDTIKNVALWIRKNLSQIERNNFAGIINMSLAKWKEII